MDYSLLVGVHNAEYDLQAVSKIATTRGSIFLDSRNSYLRSRAVNEAREPNGAQSDHEMISADEFQTNRHLEV